MAAFLCSWGFGQIPGLVACGPTQGLGPILAFEFVRSPADVVALFGVEPCRSAFVMGQKYGLLLDALGFIPAYTAFLICAVLACSPAKDGVQLRAARGWGSTFAGERAISSVAITCLLIAALCDQIEGVLLYRILSDLPGEQSLIDALWWPVYVKFALLSFGMLGIAALLLASRRIGGIVASLSIGLGALTALAGLIAGPSPVMTIGFATAWITLLLCAFAGSWRASLFSARAGPLPSPAPPTA